MKALIRLFVHDLKHDLILIAITLFMINLSMAYKEILSGQWAAAFLHLLEHIQFHVLVSLIGLILWFLWLISKVADKIALLIGCYRSTDSCLREVMLSYFDIYLQDARHKWASLTGGNDNVLTRAELTAFTSSCFRANKGKAYFGTDSNPPSVFQDLYPTYLEEHVISEDYGDGNLNKGRKDMRVLIVAKETLEQELSDQTKANDFIQFKHSHVFAGIRLLQIDPSIATAEALRLGFLSPDIAIFNRRFVVFFKPDGGPTFSVKVAVIDHTNEASIRTYLSKLNAHALELHINEQQRKLELKERTAETKHADNTERMQIR